MKSVHVEFGKANLSTTNSTVIRTALKVISHICNNTSYLIE